MRIYVLLFTICSHYAFCQSDNFLHKRYVVERLSSIADLQSGSIPNLPSQPAGIVGDVYLTPQFQEASFILYKDKRQVNGYNSKYDIHRNEFNVITQQGIRVLNGDLVRSAVCLDSLTKAPHYLFNGKEFKSSSGTPYSGFFELLSEGKMPLLKKTEVEFIKANFSPALNVGSKDHKYIKKDAFYFLKDGVLQPIPKKKFFSIFGEQEKAIEEYAKELRPKEEKDLNKIFDYFNSMESRR
jgi:hypothetical protein